MKEKQAIQNLREMKEVLEKFKIKHWLDWGTLLGAMRNGKIIGWDVDIDLGMWDSDRDKILLAISELERRKFKVDSLDLRKLSVLKLFRFGCNIDLCLYRVKGEKATYNDYYILPLNVISRILTFLNEALSYRVWQVDKFFKVSIYLRILEQYLFLLPLTLKKIFSNKIEQMLIRSKVRIFQIGIPKRYFENFRTKKFYGMTFNIPYDVEDYLKFHYGEDWKIPNKDWLWSRDDGAVRLLRRT